MRLNGSGPGCGTRGERHNPDTLQIMSALDDFAVQEENAPAPVFTDRRWWRAPGGLHDILFQLGNNIFTVFRFRHETVPSSSDYSYIAPGPAVKWNTGRSILLN
jgi:hypothetical protein